jgi:hypothetical protein
MQIQPVNQPNFRGSVYFLSNHGDRALPALRSVFEKEVPKLEKIMQDKNYNLYITQNKSNMNLYNVDANTSIENVRKFPEGRVKIFKDAAEAVMDAAQDAINIFEEHLAYLKIREKIDIK